MVKCYSCVSPSNQIEARVEKDIEASHRDKRVSSKPTAVKTRVTRTKTSSTILGRMSNISNKWGWG